MTFDSLFQPVVEIQHCWANPVFFHRMQWMTIIPSNLVAVSELPDSRTNAGGLHHRTKTWRANKTRNSCGEIDDLIAAVHPNWWVVCQFVKINNDNCLGWSELSLKRFQCISLHFCTISQLCDGIFGFTLYEAFQIRQLDVMVPLNWPYHSCHWRELPLNLGRFQSGMRSFLLRSRSSASSFYSNSARCLKHWGVNHWRRKQVIPKCRHQVTRGGHGR